MPNNAIKVIARAANAYGNLHSWDFSLEEWDDGNDHSVAEGRNYVLDRIDADIEELIRIREAFRKKSLKEIIEKYG